MKTHTYNNIAARLLVLLVAVLTLAPAVAQDSRQYAIFNYRNDGSFNAFLNEEIDSISYSCIDSLGIEHDEVVVQEVWTPDSLYRIPIDAIDSLAFRAPAPKMRDNLFYIRDYHISHTLSLEDLTIYFNGTINNDSLPSVGQMVLCLLDEQPFDEGFAGRVMEVNRLGDRIEVVCAQASPCDVFERLVLVGMAVSDLNEYESKMKVRRKGDSSMGIEEIELPEKWKDELKVEFLDLLSITSKKPTVRYKYYLDISAFNFYIGGDIWIDHPDLTYKVTFDWDKISKLGKEYDEVKEVWNLFKEGNYDAIRLGEKEKNLEEKQWEKKIPIPFQAGPFDCVFEIGAMIKPEAVNLKANWEMKTSAFHHMGFFVQGHNPLAPSAIGIDEDWKKEGANKWYQKPCTSFKAEVDIEGSLAFGVFARLKASLLTKHLLRASVGAEAGLKLSYTGAFTLTDSDCDVPNVYGLLKDTNVGAKLYGKVKAEAGALPFNLINLQGELEYPFWEGKFYLFPHFTEPSLTNTLYGYSRKDNEMFTTSVSEDLIPFLSCYPGLAFYSDNGNSRWDNREALYLDDISYKFESDVSLLNEIEYSAYEAGLAPGETYRCYPVFKMFGHVWKAGPFTEFTYPKPLSMENPSLILQKNAQQMVRISGGWGDYNISCEPKDVVKAEIEKSGNFSQVRITALKDGTATVKVFDKRSLESATVEIKVFGNPDEGAAITVSEEDIDFGSVAYGEVASGSFKVTNHGSVELAFNVNNSETNINNGFIVNGANTLQYLQPGKSMTFKVTANGTGPSHYRMGVLYIYSNATKDPVSIGLKVKGKSTSVKYIDLGLSVKWAECNLGALDTASGCGDYFAWGETDSKSSYGWNSYTHCDGSAATSHDLGDIEGTDYDAAHYQWGDKWRLPTADELKELKEKCTWTWDASLQLVGGLPGYRVTGPNGKSIFLEAAGYVDGVDIKYLNKGGVYMSGKQGDESAAAYMLAFEEGDYEIGEADRYKGVSLRPVYDESNQGSAIRVEPSKLDFGEVELGLSKTAQFVVKNVSSESVKFVVRETHGEIDIYESGKEFTLSSGEEKTFVVSYRPISTNNGINIRTYIDTNSQECEQYIDFSGSAIAPNYDSVELIYNGDFSLGAVGFTSDYVYVSEKGSRTLWDEGKYAVGTCPRDYHFDFRNNGDHTTGTGNMLIVNGSTDNKKYAWKQSVYVEKGKTYEFSAWFISVSGHGSAQKDDIEYNINGIANLGNYDKTENGWDRYYWRYTATETGQIMLKIRTMSAAAGGNDFAIDDISFTRKTSELAYLSCPDGNHPHMIDLGLSSGTKWACCNVGATKPDEFGDMYAWGETEVKEEYTEENYLYNGKNLGSNICGTEYDVAHVKWGGNWQMPTRKQIEELIEKCSHEECEQNGVPGMLFTGKNGNSIFLPFTEEFEDWEGYTEQWGDYWSGTLYSVDNSNSYELLIRNSGRASCIYSSRERGKSIRPVDVSLWEPPTLIITPENEMIDFGVVFDGTDKKKSFSVKNTGNSNVTIYVDADNGFAKFFEVSDNMKQITLSPGASKNYTVTAHGIPAGYSASTNVFIKMVGSDDVEKVNVSSSGNDYGPLVSKTTITLAVGEKESVSVKPSGVNNIEFDVEGIVDAIGGGPGESVLWDEVHDSRAGSHVFGITFTALKVGVVHVTFKDSSTNQTEVLTITVTDS